MPNQNYNQSFEELHKFSEELIKLGQEIEAKFREKEALELEIREKEQRLNELRREIFQDKGRLAKVNQELIELEKKRKERGGDQEIPIKA